MKTGSLLTITFLVFSSAAFVGCTKADQEERRSKSEQATLAHEDPEGYYTCPMHPQVHEHAPGKCPICGMALVKVASKKAEPTAQAANSQSIPATDAQLSLAGISKHTVTRKDLTFTIPVSGRFLSKREIAFQLYESDLDVVKPGLSFEGTSSFSQGAQVHGTIRSIDNLLDPASRTSRVIGILAKPQTNAAVEGAFSGQIKVELRDQIAVPEDAVLHTGLKDIVYVFGADNRLRPTPVTIGQRAGDEYQVLSGLNEGDTISRGSNFLIDSEAKIRGSTDSQGNGKASATPACPEGERWDVAMAMCMSGKGK